MKTSAGKSARNSKRSRPNPQDEKDRAQALGGQDVAASPGVAKGMQRETSRRKQGARKSDTVPRTT